MSWGSPASPPRGIEQSSNQTAFMVALHPINDSNLQIHWFQPHNQCQRAEDESPTPVNTYCFFHDLVTATGLLMLHVTYRKDDSV